MKLWQQWLSSCIVHALFLPLALQLLVWSDFFRVSYSWWIFHKSAVTRINWSTLVLSLPLVPAWLTMESPGDSTAVIRMRKDFDAFISGSGSNLEHPSFRLNLDADVYPSTTRHQPTFTEATRKILGNTWDWVPPTLQVKSCITCIYNQCYEHVLNNSEKLHCSFVVQVFHKNVFFFSFFICGCSLLPLLPLCSLSISICPW